MIVSHQRQFIFLHIHKTAGESITKALAPLLGDDDLVLNGSDLDRKIANLTKHSNAAQIRNYVGADVWESYFTFSVVRHPIDRIFSLYYFVATLAGERNSSFWNGVIRRFSPLMRKNISQWPVVQAYQAGRCFSDFIRHPAFDDDPAALSQYNFLTNKHGQLMVDFVARFEQLNDDFQEITERLKIPGTALKRHNVSARPAGTSAHITTDDAGYLYTRYQKDFERFGYSPPAF